MGRGQLNFPRYLSRDGQSVRVNTQYPREMADEERATTYSMHLGHFNRNAQFEMFLHTATRHELAPRRRWDQTAWKGDQGGNIKALHDHSVECRDNEVLSFWNMRHR